MAEMTVCSEGKSLELYHDQRNTRALLSSIATTMLRPTIELPFCAQVTQKLNFLRE